MPAGLPHVDAVGELAVLVHDAHLAQPRMLVARARLEVGPDAPRRRAADRLEVVRNDLVARPVADDLATVEQDRPVAEPRQRLHLVGDEDTVRPERLNSSIRPRQRLLELGVADGEHLVHEQDLRLEVRGHREREPHVHAARVPLDRRVEERRHAGEVDDLGQLARDLAASHAEDGAVQVDVLAAGQLGMEARADLEQAADAAADDGLARRSAS